MVTEKAIEVLQLEETVEVTTGNSIMNGAKIYKYNHRQYQVYIMDCDLEGNLLDGKAMIFCRSDKRWISFIATEEIIEDVMGKAFIDQRIESKLKPD